MNRISKNVLLIFYKDIMYKPIIFKLVKDFNITFNVLEARILPKHEGRIILELTAPEDILASGITYLTNEGVVVEPLEGRIQKNDDLCIDCGACTSVCNVEALVIDRETMKVQFYPEKCVDCGLCIKACPVNAMHGTTIEPN